MNYISDYLNRLKSIMKRRELVRAVVLVIGVIVIVSAAIFIITTNKSKDELLDISSSRSSSISGDPNSGAIHEYDYAEAPNHIGERAKIKGTVVKTFTAKSGVTFLDFCQGFDACPFSAVIFASDLPKFGDLKKYKRSVKLTGVIKSYQGQAEMILSAPEQVD